MLTASIVGGSGFVGGELVRLLLNHPEIELRQVTSQRFSGEYLKTVHPHLRGRTTQKFVKSENLEEVDVLFLALPHGESSQNIDRFLEVGNRIIDLSSDFRFNSSEQYRFWYGKPHPAPEHLERFVYGLPEINRGQIQGSDYVAIPGCNATASILSLYPLASENLIEDVVVDAMVGTSEGGRSISSASHHPIRAGSLRSYRPVGHRHVGEIEENLQLEGVKFSATSFDFVRGVMITGHVQTREPIDERQLWKLFRKRYGEEPFIRLINGRKGIFRYPDPRMVIGTNYADIGFAVDPHNNRIVVLGAIDNLMKGAAGQAVQSLNLMFRFEETMGLDYHPIFPI